MPIIEGNCVFTQNLAKLYYFTNPDFPEKRGFPLLNHHLGAQVAWGRHNLTSKIKVIWDAAPIPSNKTNHLKQASLKVPIFSSKTSCKVSETYEQNTKANKVKRIYGTNQGPLYYQPKQCILKSKTLQITIHLLKLDPSNNMFNYV